MAARAAGASRTRILFRHVLPNVMGPIVGRGDPAARDGDRAREHALLPRPRCATTESVARHARADAKGDIDNDPIRVLTPGFLIVMIVLCVNFLGDGLRDALDPRSKNERG